MGESLLEVGIESVPRVSRWESTYTMMMMYFVS